MRVYYGVDEYEASGDAVVTSGTFDGVHIGHKTIIKRLKEVAEKINGQTVLLTFHPHPRLVLYPEQNDLRLLNTLEEKIELLDKSGIDHLIIQPFTLEFSRLSSVEYVRDVLVSKIRTKKLVIGYDHHFGRNREGSFEHLKEYGGLYGFDVEEIPAQDINNVKISSTKIRKALMKGDVKLANRYLGYEYPLSGKVARGNHIGKSIGFPTANIDVDDPYKLIPANGVYAVLVMLEGKQYKGMLNIGTNPTVNKEGERKIEVNIFKFDMEIYGKSIQVQFIDRLRDEKKFKNIESLKKQLEIDKNKSLNLFV